MLYLVVFAVFLIWAVIVARKGRFNFHTLLGIYFIIVFVSDYADVTCDYFLNFYDLAAQLLQHPGADNHLAIIISDGLIFPVVGIVFSYYVVRYRRPLLTSLLFAALLGLIEYPVYIHGYMTYHFWQHWVTPLLAFAGLLVLAHYAPRLVHYNPPVSYRAYLAPVVFGITEWPGAILARLFLAYQFHPGLFQYENAEGRFYAMTLATAVGLLAAALINVIPKKFKFLFFLSLGSLAALLTLWMHALGMMRYNHWNSALTVVRYLAPCVVIYYYDRWETTYRELLKSAA